MRFDVRAADFSDPRLDQLIAFHLGQARANSPEGYSFALGVDALRQPEIALFVAYEGSALVAMGALKTLTPEHGELKSMRTAPEHLRKGAATAMLTHLLGEARLRGLRRVSLETGTTDVYQPAVALYVRHGFQAGDTFGDYAPSPHNRCYHLELG
ncbi:MAG: GNAT family N-acetyltransferase [Caulobacterales bacterium]|jgi:putative acetyltransferase